jgi:hypothetical protein
MKVTPAPEVLGERTRLNAAVVVEDPRIVVVESQETADPGAIADALEMIVRWAVRAHTRCNPSMGKAAEIAPLASIGAGEQA